jgi:hypothetical protein
MKALHGLMQAAYERERSNKKGRGSLRAAAFIS